MFKTRFTIASVLLTILFLASPTFARDFTYTYKGQTLTYTVLDEDAKTCETKHGNSSDGTPGNSVTGELFIPEIATDNNGNNYTVTKIGDYSFQYCLDLTGSLTIPNSVTEIGDGAFNCCGFTGTLTIPVGVTSIGDVAFAGCGFTGSLIIPEGITAIEYGAFAECHGFTGSLTIPEGVTSIGDEAFGGCGGFTGELIIPKSVSSIGEMAFYFCRGFTGSLTIPEGVTSIKNQAFYGCGGFNGSLTIPESVTSIEEGAFYSCSGLTGSLTIPGSVTSIGESAFFNCSGLTGSLTIPGSVTSIGNEAFHFCSGFNGSLTIQEGVTSIGTFAFSTCSGFTGSLTIPESLTSIEPSTFQRCSGFNGTLTLPYGLTSIGLSAFEECSGFIGPLTIPESVTSIGEYAFRDCKGFTGSLSIPDGITIIGTHVFNNCTGLDGILTLGSSLKKLGPAPFSGCKFDEIYSLNPIPPTSIKEGEEGDVFSADNKTAILYVQAGSEAAYKASTLWSDFQISEIEPTGVTLSKTTASINIGESQTLTATVMPDFVENKTVTWSSSAPTVASVDASGKVTALALGSATITATTTNGKSATCTVTVSPKMPEAIEIKPSEASITEKTSLHLSANITPEDVTDPTVVWTSSDESVATVDEDGMVNGLQPGTVTITATTVNGITATSTVKVVVATIPVKTITLTRTKVDIELTRSITLKPNIAPANATDKSVTWTSSDETVATVNASGEVTTLALGTATITVTTANGLTATCDVTVVTCKEIVDGLIYEIIPGDGETGEDVAKVIGGDTDENGEIKIPDEVEIDGKIYPVTGIGEDAFKDRTDIKEVVISKNVEKVGDEAFAGCINLKKVIEEDGEKPLTFGKDAFKDAPIEELYHGRDHAGNPYAGNDKLAKVEIGDKVTAISSGEYAGCKNITDVVITNPVPPVLADDAFEQEVFDNATLTVPDGSKDAYKAAEGWNKFFTVVEESEIPVVSVELNVAALTLVEGESQQLIATVTPDDATDASLLWTTSDAAVATVGANGMVTAVKPGTATITATTANGLTATCAVTVTTKPVDTPVEPEQPDDDDSAIDGVEADGAPAVSVEGGDILISGNGVAEVFSLTGSRVAVTSAGRVSSLPRGTYLVRTAGKTYKVRL